MSCFKMYLVECRDDKFNSFDDKYGLIECWAISRGDGSYKENAERLMRAQKEGWTVLTNDETLLRVVQMEDKRYPIYIWRDNKWVWIHDLYENIRKENDLLKMYYGGMFDEIMSPEELQAWEEYEYN